MSKEWKKVAHSRTLCPSGKVESPARGRKPFMSLIFFGMLVDAGVGAL